MEEPDYLVCLPVMNDPAGVRMAAGSIKSRCSECDRAIWIAPTGRELVKEKGLTVICVPCSIRKDKEAQDKGENPAEILIPTPEQQEEIRRTLDKKYRISDDQTP